MKFPFAFSIIFLILMFSYELSESRTGPEEHWKAIMGDQPMPDAINGLFDQQFAGPSSEENGLRSHFKRDFDVSANAIIYHPHDHHVDHHDHDQDQNILKV